MTLTDLLFQWTGRKGSWLATEREISAMFTAAEAETSTDAKLWQEFGVTIRNHVHDSHHKRAIELIETATTKAIITPHPRVPLDKLPAIIRDVVIACDRQLNTSPPMGLVCALCVVALAVQGRFDVDQGRYGRLPLNQYGYVIAPSGVGKTTAFKRLTRGIAKSEMEDQQNRDSEWQAYEAVMVRYKDAIKKLSGEELTQEDLAKHIAKIIKPKPPMSFRRVLLKLTTNGLLKEMKTKPTLGIFESDAGSVLDSHSFNNQAMEFVATLTALWQGDPAGKGTGVEEIYVAHRRLTLLLMGQPEMSNKFLGNPEYRNQGILNRILFVEAEQRPRLKNLAPPGNPIDRIHDEAAFETFNHRVYQHMRAPLTVNDDLELETRTIAYDGQGRPDIDSPAWYYIAEWADNIIEQQTTYKEVETFAHRIHEFAFKFAATFACFDNRSTITVADAEAATALASYFIDERLRIEQNILPTTKDLPTYKLALAVLAKLQRKWRETGRYKWTERELRIAIALLKPAGTRKTIFTELIEQGWISRRAIGKHGTKATYEIELTTEGSLQKT